MREYRTRVDWNEKQKQWRKDDPRRVLLYHAKHRAKKLNIEFDLELNDIVIPPICPLLDIPIVVSEGRLSGGSPSLDRVDNNKGYTKDNIRVISHKANSMKREHTQETLEKFLKYVKGEL